MNNRFLFLAISLLLMAGCRASRVAISELPPHYHDIEFVKQQVQIQAAEFDHLNARVRMRYRDDLQNISANVQIRARKDSIIWMSVMPMLGIEAARILITPDSITVIDRIQRNFSVSTIEEIRNAMGMPELNFSFIQNLLSGNPVFTIDDNYELEVRQQQLSLQHESAFERVIYHIVPEIFRPSRIEYSRLVLNQRVSIDYSGHGQEGQHFFPYSINFDVHAPNRLSLSLEVSKYTVNEPQEFPFSIPDSYERRP